MKRLLLFLLGLIGLLWGVATDNILALNWHNGYCALHPRAKDCALQFGNDWSSTHFTLHGLWPQNGNYCSNQPLQLSPGLLKLLRQYMPGVVDGLHIHEWRKHGTCFGTDAQTYFFTAIKLTRQFNSRQELTPTGMVIGITPTPIQRYFATHMGQYVTLQQVRWLFKKSFGNRNGRKFQLVCQKKGRFGVNYITEIRVRLKGNPVTHSLQELIDEAPPMVGVRQCPGGIIAPPPM
jgi:ribonuclease T2